MGKLLGAGRPPRLSLEEAADQVLAGHLSVGEAARLTGRKKSEIGVAVEHVIYRRSRIGRDDGAVRRRRKWWRSWPVLLAAVVLAIEAAAALAVFHGAIRALLIAPQPPAVAPPIPVQAAPAPVPPPPVPPSMQLAPFPPPPARTTAPSEPARPPPRPAKTSCAIKPEERAALAAVCRTSGAAFAPPECECLR